MSTFQTADLGAGQLRPRREPGKVHKPGADLSAPREGQTGEQPSPSGRTRPQVAGQLGPWKVLQSPFGTFHIQVLPSAVPARRTGARGCHSIHWAERKGQPERPVTPAPQEPILKAPPKLSLLLRSAGTGQETEPDTPAAPGERTAFELAWSGEGETGPHSSQLLPKAPGSRTPPC